MPGALAVASGSAPESMPGHDPRATASNIVMTAPEYPALPAGGLALSAPLAIDRLRRRADFLALNRARRQATAGMVVQGRDRGDGTAAIRVGFTCSRKLGNAVARNRAKRRLREVARLVLPGHGRAGWDYVLIGRAGATAERDFDALKRDFLFALKKLHGAAA